MRSAWDRLLGHECELDESVQALRDHAQVLDAPVVGAMHITCADESEHECVEAFQRGFVDYLLPPLKFTERAAFRLSNLGARYEEGALAVAEHHYATPATRDAFKVLVIKVNAHVAADTRSGQTCWGRLQRYETASAACGALHALMDGADLPALRELAVTFRADGIDRLARLLDPAQVDPAHRSLCVALVSARLQTRRVLAAIERHQPHTPTVYLVASCVTLNRAERDTEVVCGIATVDRRTKDGPAEYVGLGDDPAAYKLGDDFGRLIVRDASWDRPPTR